MLWFEMINVRRIFSTRKVFTVFIARLKNGKEFGDKHFAETSWNNFELTLNIYDFIK